MDFVYFVNLVERSLLKTQEYILYIFKITPDCLILWNANNVIKVGISIPLGQEKSRVKAVDLGDSKTSEFRKVAETSLLNLSSFQVSFRI